jgi:hypothetical protein
VSKATEHPTRFDNLSDGQLVDELGALKAELAELNERENALKSALIARGVGEVEGARFRASISAESIRWTLDGAAVKAEMGEAWVPRHSKRSRVSPAVRIAARIASSGRIAA